jgi:hypothetical protein
MNPHDLYGLPLERFVPERTALAKRLRAEERRADAERIAALPKPSRAAWAVNQLVRTQRRAITSLFEAGDAVQRSRGGGDCRNGPGAYDGIGRRPATRREGNQND